MKILAIHNFHRSGSASGDDQVFKNETLLLEKKGHDVLKYTVCNDEFDNSGIIGKIRTTLGMFWSAKHYKEVKKIVKDYNPDIVHIHTFFPLLSPSILYAAKKMKKPVVATLHDTRFVCPCATSLRNNQVCNKCLDGNYYRMISYKCFKNSRIQGFIVALIFRMHRHMRSFYNQINKYICLNDSQIELLKKDDYNPEKIVKKYNFVEDKIKTNISNLDDFRVPDRFVVYYGRIGEEKGIKHLMKAWDRIHDINLVVMGSGPLEKEFETWAKKKNNVFFLGYVEHDKCIKIVEKGEFVVFPSIWYEGCSMVVIETQMLGKGILATDIGFTSESIKDGYNGLKYKLADLDEFVEKTLYLWNNHDICVELGKNARKEFEEKYTADKNYKQLYSIYKELVNDNYE